MTFAPDSQAGKPWPGSRTTRAMLFWLLMVVAAVVLWRISSTPRPKGRELSYADFQDAVQKQNVREVTFYLRANTALVVGTLRSNGEAFRTVVPKGAVSGINSQLRKQGVRIEVREGSVQHPWNDFLFNVLPLLVLVLFWIFVMRKWSQRRRQQ
jgi:ATP-dependent Zn protease